MVKNAYVLTTDKNSDRAKNAERVLRKIGFNIIFFEAFKEKNPMISHRRSMEAIYDKILEEEKEDYCCIFEDDIDTTLDINLDYISNYESLNEDVVYLGFCYNKGKFLKTHDMINGENLYRIKGGIRGIHSLLVSRKGVELLKKLYQENQQCLHMDVLLERYSLKQPLFVVKKDARSPCHGSHYGIFYQERRKFKSQLDKNY